MIYYNDSMRVLQVPRGVSLNFVGLEVEGRVRAYRKMYVEGMACLQRGAVSDSVDDYFQKYAAHLPNVYGRLSIFYQNDKVASYKGILKIGVDMRFGSTYLADAIDIVSGEYFPTKISYTMNYYPRIDVLFATHIKRAYVFFKWVNVADGLITRGNYTTPFYPVFPRMLTAGINWTFFD
jgi:hypothetical protein